MVSNDQLPRINLIPRHVIRLNLTSVLSREGNDSDGKETFELVDGVQSMSSGTEYRRSGQRHVITAQVAHDWDSAGGVRVDLSYDAGQHVADWVIPKEARREAQIARLLASPWTKQDHSFQVDFMFHASEVASTFLALPLGVPLRSESAVGVYVTSVSGLVQDSDSTFGVELRRFDDEALVGYVLRLFLSSDQPWSSQLLTALLDRAWGLNDGLIALRSSR